MTAVEFLESEMQKLVYIAKSNKVKFDELFEQAKEMEREQIMDAFIFSKDPFGLSIGNSHTIKKAEDYYNTTFKSE